MISSVAAGIARVKRSLSRPKSGRDRLQNEDMNTTSNVLRTTRPAILNRCISVTRNTVWFAHTRGGLRKRSRIPDCMTMRWRCGCAPILEGIELSCCPWKQIRAIQIFARFVNEPSFFRHSVSFLSRVSSDTLLSCRSSASMPMARAHHVYGSHPACHILDNDRLVSSYRSKTRVIFRFP